jgi:LysR family transcriptional regulator, glycine cleavage system transcriptional activator
MTARQFDNGQASGCAKSLRRSTRVTRGLFDVRAGPHHHPIHKVEDVRHHTLLHSTSTRTAWSHWLREADAPRLRAAHDLEFDHAYLQLAAAVEGLGVTLASLPMIGRDIAAGRLVSPIAAPTWRTIDHVLVFNADQATDKAVMAFEQCITMMAGRNR